MKVKIIQAQLKKELREGEMLPKYYGIAYRRIDELTAICYPIPLNVVVGYLNKFWLWLRMGGNAWKNGYFKGKEEGLNEGRKYAFNQYKEQVKRQEIRNIIDNYDKEMIEVLEKNREGKNIDGWKLDFIEKETKRIN